MLWVFGVIVFVLVLLVSIGLHEWGHMFVAKRFGLSVPRYFVGFGPTLWSFKRNGTEYGIKGIPAGGFVEIFDPNIDDEKDPDRGLLTQVHPLKRIAVFAAGPFVNIFLGIAILIVSLLLMPYSVPTTVINNVDSCAVNDACGAYLSGVKAGDTVVSIDGKQVKEIATGLKNVEDGKSVDLTILRNGEEIIIPTIITDHRLGVNVDLAIGRRSFPEAAKDLAEISKGSAIALVELPSKLPDVAKAVVGKQERAEDSPGSIVAAADVYGTVTASDDYSNYEKFIQLLFYAGAINLSIGLINLLLPMLPLDGGRIFVASIDGAKMAWAKVFRKEYNPMEYKWIEAMTLTMGVMIFGMMGLLILADFVAPINIA